MEREAEEKLFPLALKYGTGVIVRIPLLFGLLTGKFRHKSTFGKNDHRNTNLSSDKMVKYLEGFERFKPLFSKNSDYSAAQLSLRFCISHPACHTVIPGGKTISQVQENVVASELDFLNYENFQV